jgi:hypothetical protein
VNNERWGALVLILVSAASLLNAIWIIAVCPIVPMTDLPIWLQQGWLFARMLEGRLPAAYHLFPAPVPNSASTILIGTLTLNLGVNAAGKVVIAFAILMFVAGAWRLIASLGAPRDHFLFLLPVILVPTHFLFSGELSHLLGLGFSFFFLGYVLSRVDNPEALKTGWLVALAILIFFSSFTAFIPMALISFVIALGTRDRTLSRKLGIACLVPALMLAWYTAARASGGEVSPHSWNRWDNVGMLAGNMVDLLSPFQGFAPWIETSSESLRLLAGINAVFCAALVAMIGWSLWLWSRGGKKHGVVLAAALITLAMTIFAGRQLTSAAIGERFVFPALITLCAWLGSEWRGRGVSGPITFAAYALLVVTGIYLHRIVIPVSQDLATALNELSTASSREQFTQRCENISARSWTPAGGPAISHFLPNNAVAIRIVYYDCIKAAAEVPIWPTGIFRYDGPGSYDDQCSWTQCLN